MVMRGTPSERKRPAPESRPHLHSSARWAMGLEAQLMVPRSFSQSASAMRASPSPWSASRNSTSINPGQDGGPAGDELAHGIGGELGLAVLAGVAQVGQVQDDGCAYLAAA